MKWVSGRWPKDIQKVHYEKKLGDDDEINYFFPRSSSENHNKLSCHHSTSSNAIWSGIATLLQNLNSKCDKREPYPKEDKYKINAILLFWEQPKILISSIVSHEIIIQIHNFITCMLCYTKENSINLILFFFGCCCLF